MAFVSAAISSSIPLRTGRFQAEKEWPGPPSARDMSGDLGQTAVPGTLIFIAGLGSSHNMFSALPLAKQTSSGLYALGLCNSVGFSAFNLGRDLPQAATAGGAEAAKGLFLQPVGEDANHQFPPYADWNGFLEQLTPELAKSRFLHCGE
jgi:hypothetical protein